MTPAPKAQQSEIDDLLASLKTAVEQAGGTHWAAHQIADHIGRDAIRILAANDIRFHYTCGLPHDHLSLAVAMAQDRTCDLGDRHDAYYFSSPGSWKKYAVPLLISFEQLACIIRREMLHDDMTLRHDAVEDLNRLARCVKLYDFTPDTWARIMASETIKKLSCT